MPDHKSLSVVESLHIPGFQAGAALNRAVNENKNMPREFRGFLKNLRIYFRLFFRQVPQGVYCNILIIPQKFAERGYAESRQFGR